MITADRVGGGTPEASVAYVMIARFLPGLLMGSAAGVLVDRWDRKRTMMVCDLGRAATLLWLPFVDFIWQLVLASLILEGFALLWAPAKEASVPNLVPREKLTGVNSLSLVATYGTFPVAAAVSIGLASLATVLGRIEAIDFLRIDAESLAFYIDAATFAASAAIIYRLALPRKTPVSEAAESQTGQPARAWAPEEVFKDLRDGWSYIFLNPTVRTVNIALAVGLIGGGHDHSAGAGVRRGRAEGGRRRRVPGLHGCPGHWRGSGRGRAHPQAEPPAQGERCSLLRCSGPGRVCS